MQNVFQTIYDLLADGQTLRISMTRKNETLTVSMMPEADEATSEKLKPLNITGTPEELAEGFAEAATTPLTKSLGLLTNAQSVTAAADEAAAAPKKQTPAAKKADKKSEKKAVKKADKKSTAEPKEQPEPADADQVQEEPKPDLFNQE